MFDTLPQITGRLLISRKGLEMDNIFYRLFPNTIYIFNCCEFSNNFNLPASKKYGISPFFVLEWWYSRLPKKKLYLSILMKSSAKLPYDVLYHSYSSLSRPASRFRFGQFFRGVTLVFLIFEKCAFQALFDIFKCLQCMLFEVQSILIIVFIRYMPIFVTNIAENLN